VKNSGQRTPVAASSCRSTDHDRKLATHSKMVDPALQRLAEMKPPAKIDGLLQLKKDLSECFTLEEQKDVWASEAGQKIGQAFHRCEGHSRQWLDAQQKLMAFVATKGDEHQKTNSQEILALKREAVLKKFKYVDCLAYMTCPRRWSQYTSCWVQTVGNLSPKQLRTYKEQGALELICRAPRDSLERGIGELVSSAVQAGDSSAIEEDLIPLPLLDSEE